MASDPRGYFESVARPNTQSDIDSYNQKYDDVTKNMSSKERDNLVDGIVKSGNKNPKW